MQERLIVSVEYESLIESVQPQTRDVIITGGLPQAIVRADTDKLKLHSGQLRVGGEWWIMNQFAVRAGVDRIFNDDLDGLSPTLGFSVQQDLGQLGALFEYAFRRESYASGLAHILSVRLNL